MQIVLEVTLTNRSKTIIGKDHQDVANQFFDDFGEALQEVVSCKLYDMENPEEFCQFGGNQTCVESLKHLRQGIMPGGKL
jgi:hypothetical protein|tara:strand:- start:282 stop:521 length:240 start_codon:yes stop_codon:yes gene_type:complete